MMTRLLARSAALLYCLLAKSSTIAPVGGTSPSSSTQATLEVFDTPSRSHVPFHDYGISLPLFGRDDTLNNIEIVPQRLENEAQRVAKPHRGASQEENRGFKEQQQPSANPSIEQLILQQPLSLNRN
jgi:hypothetical protein